MATRRTPLTPILCAKLAEERFRPLEEGKGLVTFSELLGQFENALRRECPEITGMSEAAQIKLVERAVATAFKKGFISVKRKPIVKEYKLNTALSAEMATTFRLPKRQLREAIVVDVPPMSPDELHGQLGYALAEHLSNTRYLFPPSGGKVAVGSGRSVHAVLTGLEDFRYFDVDEITIMSLTGSAYSHSSEQTRLFLMDADVHVALLAQRFTGRVHTVPMLAPLVNDPGKRNAVRKNAPTNAGKADRNDGWFEPLRIAFERESTKPTHAIIGVGFLGAGHRLYDEFVRHQQALNEYERERRPDQQRPAVPPILENIYKPLGDLIALSRRVASEPICGDCCHRLFVLSNPEVANISKKDRSDLDNLINSINSSLLTVTKTQLDTVPTVFLLGGTPAKARVMFDMLTRPKPQIHTVCIDSETAEIILNWQNPSRRKGRHNSSKMRNFSPA
ncbi:MAG TPA: hypothetical protein VEH07_03715 [Alphaproteobacteria bacterium]|nr:hypothetical protein [Alphaproteobacteria bacterium]